VPRLRRRTAAALRSHRPLGGCRQQAVVRRTFFCANDCRQAVRAGGAAGWSGLSSSVQPPWAPQCGYPPSSTSYACLRPSTTAELVTDCPYAQHRHQPYRSTACLSPPSHLISSSTSSPASSTPLMPLLPAAPRAAPTPLPAALQPHISPSSQASCGIGLLKKVPGLFFF
jgi:hypothetical protein